MNMLLVRGSILGVASIVEKMRQNKLSWFRNIMRREKSESIITIIQMNVEGKRGRRKSKKRGS